MPSPLATLHLDGAIATITLAPPGGLLDRATSEALADAARGIAEAQGVRVVIVLARAGASASVAQGG